MLVMLVSNVSHDMFQAMCHVCRRVGCLCEKIICLRCLGWIDRHNIWLDKIMWLDKIIQLRKDARWVSYINVVVLEN